MQKMLNVNNFPWIVINPKLDIIHKEEYSFDSTIVLENKKISQNCSKWKQWAQLEFVLKVGFRTVIEPEYRACLLLPNIIIGQSLFNHKLKPKFSNFIKHQYKRKDIIHVDKAIVFDDGLSWNYFHFFSRIINKIFLLDKFDIPNYPLIISKRLFETSFFKFFLKLDLLKQRKILIQEANIWIVADETYLLRPFQYKKYYFDNIFNLTKEDKQSKSTKRVFLNRSVSVGRYLDNFENIQPILKKYNFEIIDTNGMSINEQISIFSNIKYLVAIHGAGITNVIFTKNEINILEIFPENKIFCHYFWLSSIFSHKYNGVIGENLKNEKFSISPQKLEQYIMKLLTQ